ncbi:MAG: hypothetical protein KAJ49_09725, partial [Arcobacteraceae bacterium]|nr:hypothetical protein [Arcobacteraceae bacterium]
VILDVIFLIFSTIAFFISIKIYRNWDFTSTKSSQYKLEKQSHLTAVIIKYIFFLKLPLFLFFIFTLDSLSTIIVGAMCGAGVIDAVSFGMSLFILKIANMYLFGFWLLIHYGDLKYKTLEFTKLKFGYFIVIYFFLIAEIIVELLMFNSIDISKMVSCCGTLYSTSTTSSISAIFAIDPHIFVYAFYGMFLLNILFYKFKNSYGFAISNILFLVIAIISLIIFFSPYIYELPTHHCPFCVLQKDYFYIGYLLYVTLFIGTFYGVSVVISELLKNKEKSYYKISLFFTTFYTAIVTAYPVLYFISNGVWLN